MTREEAKEILTHNWTRVDNPNYSESELDEAFFMAIEALKENNRIDSLVRDDAENCKENKSKLDFVRRQAVLDALEESGYCYHFWIDIENVINSLPSAEPKTGEWIDEDGNNVPLNEDGYPLRSCYCNQCYEWLVGSDEYETKGNFCPNCGARMYKGGDDE